MPDRLHFPATERNRFAIAEVLAGLVSPGSRVLEVGCGSGEHGAFFAQRFSADWLCTDLNDAHVRSARAYGMPARVLDVTADDWGGHFDLVVSINVIHICPWACGQALLRGAARHSSRLYLYGAFFVEGRQTAPSNLAFDEGLRRQDPEWGVRHLSEVAAEAALSGWTLGEVLDMPSNNYSVTFLR